MMLKKVKRALAFSLVAFPAIALAAPSLSDYRNMLGFHRLPSSIESILDRAAVNSKGRICTNYHLNQLNSLINHHEYGFKTKIRWFHHHICK